MKDLDLGLDHEVEVIGLGTEGHVLGLGFGLVIGLESSRPKTCKNVKV